MTAGGAPFGVNPAERPRVLLVDDDEVNLMLVSAALTQHGFEITEARDGEAALRMLRDWTPDLIVLDARMPGLDGFETCRELRRMYGYENVPVLMLTGLDDETSINRAYQAGATDFFVKSNQWTLLAGRLRYMLRASRTNIELARSRSKLARAQDLAKMGSFDWWHEPGRSLYRGLVLSEQALHVLLGKVDVEDRPSLTFLLRSIPTVDRHNFVRTVRNVVQHEDRLLMDVPMNLPGKFIILHVQAEPEFGDQGHCVGYSGIVQDVTERRRARDEIQRLAETDSLTELPNRAQLRKRTEQALFQAQRMGHQVALLYIDLDRFKNINDTLGHSAGDELLREVARRLKSCVRHSAKIIESEKESIGPRAHRALEGVGRLGGDEFVALLPEVSDEAEAEAVGRRILDALREPVDVSGQECFATASVGIALYPRDGLDAQDLMRNADEAMYRAKEEGRNRLVVYSPQGASRGREQLELETALHKALERDELVLYYQPQVEASSGRMVGVEALMRWRRGEQLVPPNEFIPLAEVTGLIVPMSEWVLREAARQAAAWREEFGFDGTVAVNMPYRMFVQKDMVELVEHAVRDHRLPHRMIQLEITEESLVKDLQSIQPTLRRLNELGVQISVDDFGTGYSSLSRLTDLPISEVKIDRSFVKNMAVTHKGTAVARTIIALAQVLELRVIAEGVETEDQKAALVAEGCDLMQGFLYSRPVPGSEIGPWNARHEARLAADAATAPRVAAPAGARPRREPGA
ncbi:putative bifunctional diguanylate cyclase/phosphodiesterase [Ideonella sp.]|uniref:putative bifunctional diguanylate cyclase/phosphodiesterase n=1 Tax=Ideonella sp. TaxID=1929293 RepID=UPI0035ADBEF0